MALYRYNKPYIGPLYDENGEPLANEDGSPVMGLVQDVVTLADVHGLPAGTTIPPDGRNRHYQAFIDDVAQDEGVVEKYVPPPETTA